jgi:hypothetical protein
MSERSEELVLVYHVRDEWQGNIVVGYLRENGVEATLQSPPSVPPLDLVENLTGSDKVNGIFVLQHEAEHARSLLKEFLQAGKQAEGSNETDVQH